MSKPNRQSIEITPAMEEYLFILIKSGFFGKSRKDCVEILLARGVEHLSREPGPIGESLKYAVKKRIGNHFD